MFQVLASVGIKEFHTIKAYKKLGFVRLSQNINNIIIRKVEEYKQN
jgi:hypothetical protein